MPLAKRWTPYDSAVPPNNYGVYELAYNKSLIRIGSGRIKSRLEDHRASSDYTVTHVRWEETRSKTRAVQRERRELIEYGNGRRDLPKYNYEIPDPP